VTVVLGTSTLTSTTATITGKFVLDGFSYIEGMDVSDLARFSDTEDWQHKYSDHHHRDYHHNGSIDDLRCMHNCNTSPILESSETCLVLT
jgi:hypothetical protein